MIRSNRWTVAIVASVGALGLGPALRIVASASPDGRPYAIVDTGQVRCYDDRREIAYPQPGGAYFGQDAQYQGNPPRYRDNGDGTVSDLNTGLMWQADPGDKMTYAQAVAGASRCRTGGHDDWRLPTIKQLYSLMLFSGIDGPAEGAGNGARPFIDTEFFKFRYGDTAAGERIIDSQWATRTVYVGRVMNGQRAMFGVNFADGRIKGYPIDRTPRGTKTYFVIYVRGNEQYGTNDFVDNGDGTITDRATGLMWMRDDSAALKAGPRRDGTMNWQQALRWAEDLDYAGHDDWRLPSAKELQSIVDYTRSPDTTKSAAIDPVFVATPIRNQAGKVDYACYWSATTHVRVGSGAPAAYIAFGRALGRMGRPGSSNKTLMDVHGAGAQRSDPKSGDASRLPTARGPQGDVVRVYNMARAVRGGVAEPRTTGPAIEMTTVREPGGDSDGPPDGPSNGPPTGATFIKRHDRNGDGKVSKAEFPGPDAHFRRFDRNRDGYIEASEAPTGPPPDGPPPRR